VIRAGKPRTGARSRPPGWVQICETAAILLG
jgi:hypothetical protein